jgi:hypothetical protein
LTETDLIPMEDLGNEIRQWLLKKSLDKNKEAAAEASSPQVREKSRNTDDLYDF